MNKAETAIEFLHWFLCDQREWRLESVGQFKNTETGEYIDSGDLYGYFLEAIGEI